MMIENKINSIASRLCQESFLASIAPLTAIKAEIINCTVSPLKWVVNEHDKLVVSDGKYPDEIQARLDEVDRLIELEKSRHETYLSKQNFIGEARRILEKE